MSLQDFSTLEDNLNYYSNLTSNIFEKKLDNLISNLSSLISLEIKKKQEKDIFVLIEFAIRYFQYLYLWEQQNRKLIMYK